MADSEPIPSQQYAELAELAGGFIHEIKNHLSTLGLNLQLLAEDFANPETQRERRALNRVQRLQSECQRLVDVSNDFLRFARVQELELQPCSLVETVESMLDFFSPTAKQAKIEIQSYLPSNLPTVKLDTEKFHHALLNLLLNAEQAMPEGGSITLQASVEDSHVRLDVIDTGPGMPADVVSKVFKPFFTTKPGGNGLGLPIVRKVIEAHGGTLEVQSEPGRGTKFTMRLPVAKVEFSAPPATKS
jgi:two-component system, NtrC family, sensor histidine kinase HydH